MIAISAALLLSACNGGGEGGAEPISDMGPQQTAAAGEAITFSAHSNARDFRLAGDGSTSFAGGCTSTVPPNPIDADADGIPDELTVITYTNCNEGGVIFSGTQAIQDTNPSAAGFQFNSAWALEASTTVDGHTVLSTYDAALTAFGTTAGTFSLSDAASIEIVVSGPDLNGSLFDDHAWEVEFTPDDGVFIPGPGLPLEAGDLTLSGAMDSSLEIEGEGNTTIEGVVSTLVTLRTDPGCATSIVSGTVQVLVAEPEPGTLLVTWSGCGDTDASFADLPGG